VKVTKRLATIDSFLFLPSTISHQPSAGSRPSGTFQELST
jgi:hypothetical protein